MARTSSIFLAAALLLALVFNVHAWGVEGHGAVASIAQAYLTPKAKAAVDQIIGQSGTFKAYLDVASWPDNIRNQRKETSDWHYIDAEDDPAPPTRKCGPVRFPQDCGADESCIITAVAGAVKALVPGQAPVKVARDGINNQAEALAFLTHFAGDIAQPLHTTGYKVGANNVLVNFEGKSVKLHAAWDGTLIRKMLSTQYAGSQDKWVADLIARAAKVDVRQIPGLKCAATLNPLDVDGTEACAMEWASDSNTFVCSTVFPADFKEGMEISGDYYQNSIEPINNQIVKGGLRLAAVLNKVLGGADGPASTTTTTTTTAVATSTSTTSSTAVATTTSTGSSATATAAPTTTATGAPQPAPGKCTTLATVKIVTTATVVVTTTIGGY
ncbi:hypothetical protein GGF31_007868 [Allomyces arbusculus]|nr:hypothetical protein GGF31_007868 [Allomyces arbusculus]